MKVLLVNGSPHQKGCTYTALSEVADALNSEGIETDFYWIGNKPIATSRYWNMVHGNTPEEVKQDEEGLQTMRYLGRNMAWLLKLKEAGEKAGFPLDFLPHLEYSKKSVRGG